MPADLAVQFEEAYTDLQCLIIAQVNKFSTERLSATQYLILDYIMRKGSSSTSQLAQQFRISAPAVSRHIGKLMADKLLIQNRDVKDRRVHFNAVTPKAVRLVNEARKLRATMSLQIQHILSEKDCRAFIRLCRLIASDLNINP